MWWRLFISFVYLATKNLAGAAKRVNSIWHFRRRYCFSFFLFQQVLDVESTETNTLISFHLISKTLSRFLNCLLCSCRRASNLSGFSSISINICKDCSNFNSVEYQLLLTIIYATVFSLSVVKIPLVTPLQITKFSKAIGSSSSAMSTSGWGCPIP